MTTTTERLLQLAAAHEEKARALRLAASELNGHQVKTKQASAERTLDAAITLRRTQRPTPETEKPKPAKAKRYARLHQLAGILQQHGGGMKSEELASAARELGIKNLMGISMYVKYGYLKRTGKHGAYRYSLKHLPEESAGPA